MPRLQPRVLPRALALLAGLALLGPASSEPAELAGGGLRLELAPLLPAVRATGEGMELDATVGQAVAATSGAGARVLPSGFHTPGTPAGDALFSDGFEDPTP